MKCKLIFESCRRAEVDRDVVIDLEKLRSELEVRADKHGIGKDTAWDLFLYKREPEFSDASPGSYLGRKLVTGSGVYNLMYGMMIPYPKAGRWNAFIKDVRPLLLRIEAKYTPKEDQ